jgi:hypothetical protein
MSTLLFLFDSDGSKPTNLKHKPTELPRQLFHIIRGATDALEALSLYTQLLTEPSLPLPSDKEIGANLGYHSFDAHVGDTACQLRACMLLEVTNSLKQDGTPSTVAVIASTIFELEQLLLHSRKLMTALLVLDWKKIKSGALDNLGLTKAGLTTEELLVKLGWSKQLQLADQYHTSSSRSSYTAVQTALGITPSPSDLSEGSVTPASSIGDTETSIQMSKSKHHWDLFNSDMIIKFLVSSYVLSKYKQLTTINGVYLATLSPELAFQESQRLCPPNFACQLGKQFVHPTKRANGEEFLGLQRFLSDLSCAWLETRSWNVPDLHPNHHALLNSTIRTSAKGVKSSSSYISYLVLRSLWGEESSPMIITTTRFCPSGFHRNYFRVTMRITDNGHVEESGISVQPTMSWCLKHLTGSELYELHHCSDPHIMVSGNSINGHASDYLTRLPISEYHADDGCSDNENHCNDMLQCDQDRVVQAIFAGHRHYAFKLSGDEGTLGEDVLVQFLMDRFIPGLSTAWLKSKAEAEQLGTGSSYKLYMWQHVILESPARFLARVEGSNRPHIMNNAL